MPICTPQFSLLQEPSTVVVQVCCGAVIWVSSVTSLVYLVILRLPSIETPRPYISEPLSAARGHNSTQTAIIVVCVNSFIQALTGKQWVLTLLPVTCSQAHYIHITGLVTASAVIIVAGFFSKSGYLTLAV